jgi:hypothetical protein
MSSKRYIFQNLPNVKGTVIIEDCIQKSDDVNIKSSKRATKDDIASYEEYLENFKKVDYSSFNYPPFKTLYDSSLNPRKAFFNNCAIKKEHQLRFGSPHLYEKYGTIQQLENGQRILQLKKGTLFFKGTRFFYNHIPENDNTLWVGNAMVALQYAWRFQGGLMVYEANRDINLLLLSSFNDATIIYKKINWNKYTNKKYNLPNYTINDFSNKILDPKTAFQMKFGTGISYEDQISLIREYRGFDENQELSIFVSRKKSNFTDCRTDVDVSRQYGSLENDKIVSFLINDERNVLNIDGWFMKESFSPFACVYKEELMVFSDILKIKQDHPLYWKNWINFVPCKIEKLLNKFDIGNAFKGFNNSFRVLQYCLENKPSLTIGKFSKPDIFFLDACNFQSPNQLTSTENLCNMLGFFLSKLLPKLICIINYNNSAEKVYSYIQKTHNKIILNKFLILHDKTIHVSILNDSESFLNITVKGIKISFLNCLNPVNLSYGLWKPLERRKYIIYRNENIKYRLDLLENIIFQKQLPDLIIGNISLDMPEDEDNKLLKSYYQEYTIDNDYTHIDGSIRTRLFYNSNIYSKLKLHIYKSSLFGSLPSGIMNAL